MDRAVGLTLGGERRPGGPLGFCDRLGALGLVDAVSLHSWKNFGGGFSHTSESFDGGVSPVLVLDGGGVAAAL